MGEYRQNYNSNISFQGGISAFGGEDINPPNNLQAESIPSEAQLTLLCLDYLRDLRRAYANPDDLRDAEGLNADWITLAIFALNRAFTQPALSQYGNDAWKSDCMPISCRIDRLPSIHEMTREAVYLENPHLTDDDKESKNADPKDEDLEAFAWYDYDDSHPSNSQRFYLLNGLGTGQRGPLLLGELVAGGMSHWQARTRHDAEQEMVSSPLFAQFVQAVKSKGFFRDPENDTPCQDPVEDEERRIRKQRVYQDRMQKVVAKFRSKLASKADQGETTNLSDVQYTRRLRHCLQARKDRGHHEVVVQKSYSHAQREPTPRKPTNPVGSSCNPADLEEAERLKTIGNSHMQQKDYHAAAEAYTKALKLSPAGPNSHVYFSNRAAALLSLKKFSAAIADSERSLALQPTYGKAHARLGLAHFLLGDYRQAMEAYTVALKYEPDNKSSKSYLEKAAKRLAKAEDQSTVPGSSFSVVSEWEKHEKKQNNIPTPSPMMLPLTTTPEQRQAEKFKVQGNQHMATRNYQAALTSYTRAIELCPRGSQSHVYYSNRAAALCYLERYEEAAQDSEASLALKPNYGKAHARLGLSRFFLQDYPGAIHAYTAALKFDPDNAASKSYLAKAKLKWEQQGTPSPKGLQLDAEARRLVNDPDMMMMAKKAMSNPSPSELLSDPEMQNIAKKAIKDPTMMAAVKAVVNK